MVMPSAISRFIPNPRLHQMDRVAVAADPADAWRVVRDADLYQPAFSRALFVLRTLPDRMEARLRGRQVEPLPRTARLDQIVQPGSGFHLLAEVPGEEFVAGAVGKFWRPKIPYVDVSPGQFASFHEPGFGKVAWGLQVHPREGGGSWIALELRVDATDDEAWARFVTYFRLVGPFSHGIRLTLLSLLRKKIGAATPDAERALPGDEILPRARDRRTHAVTIEAPVDRVWPWLVQMGCRRAGWYSIDRLDNGGVRSADRIVPELQHIDVGDTLPATPRGDEGFAVLRVEPEHVLVLGSPNLLRIAEDTQQPKTFGMLGASLDATWSFVLEPIGDTATRLIVRVRGNFVPSVRAAVARPAILSAHEIMERAQLRNLKRRAERLAQAA